MIRIRRTFISAVGLGVAVLVGHAGCSVVNAVDEVQPIVTNQTGESCAATEGFCGGACIDVSADAANCGACGVACPDGVSCAGGSCDIACAAGVACGASCVELDTDPAHCGSCNRACETAANQVASCSGGSCEVACAAGFGDCNQDPSDGCEANLSNDPANCGGCDQGCLEPGNSVGSCISGTCGFDGTCDAGYDDCDNNPNNGCEERLAGNQNHCGICGNGCAANQFCRVNTCVDLVVAAADGSGHAQGNLYNINLATGAVAVVGALSAPYSALGFRDGILFGVTDVGDVNRINVTNANETFVANTGNGPRGIGQFNGARMGVCREGPHAYQVLDVETGEFSTLSNFCRHNATIFGDGETNWSLDFSELYRYSEFGDATLVTPHGANGSIRGATWHLGQIFAFRCANQCSSGATELITVDPVNGTITTVANLPLPNRLHALASPRPVN